MKTTIELSDEVFEQARQHAAQRGIDVNQFISTVVTKMVQSGAPAHPTSDGRRVEFPIIKGKPGTPVVTQEMVDRAEEQMLREEADYHAKFMRR